MARINLRKFIAEHYRGGVTARDVIREAITNSIHAGGARITVELHFSEKNGELFWPGLEELAGDAVCVARCIATAFGRTPHEHHPHPRHACAR